MPELPPRQPSFAKANQVTSAEYVTVSLASTMTGLTPKAIRRKIEEGKWVEGKEFFRTPDGGVLISIQGFVRWVEGIA
ncbi:excisionase [Paraburkholderia dipogonis]|uniref:Excisionase n=2 Tax=Paraburkholderia dipogonis TaxID=1211383 RepID=A0A4Y8NBF4_9BURK|nr:excisionase [Paraburkholderia dipogonis]